MRDAFGGAFMIRLFLVFIIIYVCFISVALNYAKAFKVKNMVIEYLEDNEITDIKKMSAVTRQAMNDYFQTEIVGGIHYVHPVSLDCPAHQECLSFEDIGIQIIQMQPTSSQTNKMGVYYKVNTYFGYNIGFFNVLLALSGSERDDNTFGNWKISGETRLIVKD
jgi:hypothetical protein